MAGLTCDSCGRGNVIGVASSSLGAVSWAWCRECLDHNAEPPIMFEFVFEDVADGNIDNLVPEFKTYQVYLQGQYWPITVWWFWRMLEPRREQSELD